MITVSNKKHPYTLILSEDELSAIKLALNDSLEAHEQEDLYAPVTVGIMVEVLSEINGIF